LIGNCFELLIRRRVILDHHCAELFDALAWRLVLRQLAEFDLGQTALRCLLVKGRVRVIGGEKPTPALPMTCSSLPSIIYTRGVSALRN
jgi:hypothetical protein